MCDFKSKLIIIVFLVFSSAINAQENDTIYMSLPDTVYSGSAFNIDIIVNSVKDIERASFKQVLPIGFMAKDLGKSNELGYYFTLNNQTLKYSWLGKVKKNCFVLTYDVNIKKGIKGIYLFEGYFIVLRDGAKEKWNVDAKKLVVLK